MGENDLARYGHTEQAVVLDIIRVATAASSENLFLQQWAVEQVKKKMVAQLTHQTGKSISGFHPVEPPQLWAASGLRPPWRDAVAAGRGRPPAMYETLRARIRGREPRPVRRRERTAATTRDGPPRLSEDDDEESDPRLTALQRASVSLREALNHARYDERTRDAFLELLAIVAARENAAFLDHEERPT